MRVEKPQIFAVVKRPSVISRRVAQLFVYRVRLSFIVLSSCPDSLDTAYAKYAHGKFISFKFN